MSEKPEHIYALLNECKAIKTNVLDGLIEVFEEERVEREEALEIINSLPNFPHWDEDFWHQRISSIESLLKSGKHSLAVFLAEDAFNSKQGYILYMLLLAIDIESDVDIFRTLEFARQFEVDLHVMLDFKRSVEKLFDQY